MWSLVVITVILFISTTNLLSPFYSRKFVHIGCGLVLAYLNCPVGFIRNVIILIAIGSILLSLTYPLRFGDKNDIGIIAYNFTVLCFVLLKEPLRILAPMFIIDPLAAIAGKTIKTRTWCHTKTVFGSFVAFVSSYITLYYVNEVSYRLLVSLVLMLVEGILENYDNLGITAVIVAYHLIAKKYNLHTEIGCDY